MKESKQAFMCAMLAFLLGKSYEDPIACGCMGLVGGSFIVQFAYYSWKEVS